MGKDMTLETMANVSCVYCGKPAEVVDHIIPKSRGGPDVMENRVPACKKCNLHKLGKTPIQFLSELLESNGFPFRYKEQKQTNDEDLKIAEIAKGYLSLRILSEEERYWFVLTYKNQVLLSGDLLALKLLGYSGNDFVDDNLSRLFSRLEIMSWLYKGLDNDDILALGSYKQTPENMPSF